MISRILFIPALILLLTACAEKIKPPETVAEAIQPKEQANVGYLVRTDILGEVIGDDDPFYTPQTAISRLGNKLLKQGLRLRSLGANHYWIEDMDGFSVPFSGWKEGILEARSLFLDKIELESYRDGGIDVVAFGEIKIIPRGLDPQAGVYIADAEANLELINAYTRISYPTGIIVSANATEEDMANKRAIDAVLAQSVDDLAAMVLQYPPRHEYLVEIQGITSSREVVFPFLDALQESYREPTLVVTSNRMSPDGGTATVVAQFTKGALEFGRTVNRAAESILEPVRDVQIDGHRIRIFIGN